MRATQPDSITKFIKSVELTFVIPVYQRNYVWKIEDCEKLFDDVLEGIQNKKIHYFGNIVYYADGTDPFTGFTRYVLIDGQQRITSTMLLLAAIRDEEENEDNRKKLTSTYLMNENAEENFRVKLKQVETDRSAYEAIVTGEFNSINKNSIIYRNYIKFRSLVRAAKASNELSSAELLDGISYLNIIAIDLESNNDGAESPQVIFESINATGEPLSTADLLRNFLLLEVGTDKQKDMYEKYWLTIEKNIGNENISDFIRRYLTLRTGEDIKKNTEYKEFKKKYREYFDNAESAIKELARYSKYYSWIRQPESLPEDLSATSKLLQDLDDLRMLPATPAIMWLLEKADTNQVSYEDVNKTLEVIGSWSFRARITNIIGTGEIGTILTTKILDLLKTKVGPELYADYLLFELSNYRLHDIYPNDKAFAESFAKYDFYKRYRRYVQTKLANFISHDKADITLESIEHIMPQTLRSTKWPSISVSDHAAWVNTIGNLTPMNMKDNPAASNESFSFKRQFIDGSDWKMTREVVNPGNEYLNNSKDWDIESIRKRGRDLSTKAAQIWLSPIERTRDIEAAQNQSRVSRTKRFSTWVAGNSFDPDAPTDRIAVSLRTDTLTASAYWLSNGDVIVSKGSQAKIENTEAFTSHSYFPLKQKLIEDGVLITRDGILEFMTDYEFDSPSAAAAIILGRAAAGPRLWRDISGRSMNEIEALINN
jgi:uncharacterized protein with ParB-like and HNH nuclease domain